MSFVFHRLLDRFTGAVEAADGAGLAALFTEDGVYHDTFYGAFRGRDEIARMLEERFWGDATRFFWNMHDPVYDNAAALGYARWVFSYTSTMEDSAGRRVVFDGMSSFRIEGGLIRHYREVFSAGIAFVQLGMAPERTDKILRRIVGSHADDPEWTRHFAG
jgi:ketosteroid isomerase-like protein